MRCVEWWQGLQKHMSRDSHQVLLGHRNLYILPSGFGSLWLLSASALYLVGINARSNTPVLLAFLMLAVLFLSLFLTHLNLQGLELRALPQAVCCADEIHPYAFETISRCMRPNLQWRWLRADAPQQRLVHLEVGRQNVTLPWQASHRGVMVPGRLLLQTTAPLGLFRCWCYWDPPEPIWVAPKRTPGPVLALNDAQVVGADLFDELRPWRLEEGLRRVDWKAVARGRGWLSKAFSEPGAGELWLAVVPSLPLERALEHLCDRLCQELRAGRRVGIQLPNGRSVTPALGNEQHQICLRALAEVLACA